MKQLERGRSMKPLGALKRTTKNKENSPVTKKSESSLSESQSLETGNMAANDKKQSHPQVGDKVRFLGSRLSPVEDEIAKVQYVLKGSGLVLTLDELAHESFKCSEWDAAKAEGN